MAKVSAANAAPEKKSKHEKLYSDSPSIKKDKEGKTAISKPSEADAENMGTEGNDIPGAGDGMPVKVKEMHDRHKKEMSDITSVMKARSKTCTSVTLKKLTRLLPRAKKCRLKPKKLLKKGPRKLDDYQNTAQIVQKKYNVIVSGGAIQGPAATLQDHIETVGTFILTVLPQLL